MSKPAGQASAAAERSWTGPEAQGTPEAAVDASGDADGALRDLSLEVIRALRQFLDLAEAVVADPDLLAGLIRTGRGLVESALPPESVATAKRTTSEIMAVLAPPELRRQLVATLAAIIVPVDAAERPSRGPDPS